jgi:hypothetical protein
MEFVSVHGVIFSPSGVIRGAAGQPPAQMAKSYAAPPTLATSDAGLIAVVLVVSTMVFAVRMGVVMRVISAS